MASPPGTPAKWKVVVPPSGTTPFKKGDAQVDVTAGATDVDYGNQYVSVAAGRVVTLAVA